METENPANEVEVTISNGVVERPLHDVTLPRAAAAGSLVVGACLLLAGRRKSALAAAVAAGAMVALEQPETAKRLWENVPHYLRRGQDFLVRMEGVVSEISAQGEKLRESMMGD